MKDKNNIDESLAYLLIKYCHFTDKTTIEGVYKTANDARKAAAKKVCYGAERHVVGIKIKELEKAFKYIEENRKKVSDENNT